MSLKLTEKNFIAGRCPDCGTGPVICRERSKMRRHGPNGICPHARCLACDFEGSVEDYEPTVDRDRFLGRSQRPQGG